MKKIICLALVALMLSQLNVIAMSTKEFDQGMENGISYFNRGLYYEAKDEFTWFKNYNYSKMNSGQQKYLDDYMNGTWNRIQQWETQQAQNIKLYPGAPLQYGRSYHIKPADAIKLIKQRYGINSTHTGTGNTLFWFEGGGHKFTVERWYYTDDINSVVIYVD